MTTDPAPHRRYLIGELRRAIGDAIDANPFAPTDLAFDITVAPTPTPQGQMLMVAYIMAATPSPLVGQRIFAVIGTPLEQLVGGTITPVVDELLRQISKATTDTLAVPR